MRGIGPKTIARNAEVCAQKFGLQLTSGQFLFGRPKPCAACALTQHALVEGWTTLPKLEARRGSGSVLADTTQSYLGDLFYDHGYSPHWFRGFWLGYDAGSILELPDECHPGYRSGRRARRAAERLTEYWLS